MDLWAKMSDNFDQWTSPLRPCLEDVEMYKRALPSQGRVLLLGVTPELQALSTVAVDHNPHVIEQLASSHEVVLGDWNDLPFGREFDAVIGDGCLTVFQGLPSHFFEQVQKVLKKNGRLILRTFIAPEERENLSDLLPLREIMGFHAYKMRVAHTLANPYVPVQNLYKILQPIWDHPTLSIYKDSPLIYYFPKLSELPKWDHIQYGSSYELAERFPVITWSDSQILRTCRQGIL